MPFISHNGNRIYYESHGPDMPGDAVILHHGMAQWAQDWVSAGWLEALAGRRVITLDAAGHGRSDRPADVSAYTVEARAAAVLAVADAEGLSSFAFFGFSMGGRVGFQLATVSPERISKLVVGGMHGLRPSVDRKSLERRVAFLRSPKWRMVERAIGVRSEDGRNNDPEALALSTEAVLMWDGAEDRLPGLVVERLLYCGDQDSLLEYARATAALIPGAPLVELPSTGHSASFYTSLEARVRVREFLSR
jgi:pimeloyl-ACP methyl ester carboxylesterase